MPQISVVVPIYNAEASGSLCAKYFGTDVAGF